VFKCAPNRPVRDEAARLSSHRRLRRRTCLALKEWAGAWSIPANADRCAEPEAAASGAQNLAARPPKPDSLGHELQPELVTALPVQRSSAAGTGAPAVRRQSSSLAQAARAIKALVSAAEPAPSSSWQTSSPTPYESSSAACHVNLASFGFRIIRAMQPSGASGETPECVAKGASAQVSAIRRMQSCEAAGPETRSSRKGGAEGTRWAARLHR
jgi:hypothetical protein